MAAIISLDQITTVLSPNPKRYSFMPSNAAVRISTAQRSPILTSIQLDTVEYCLGLKRGGIDKYKNSKLLVTTRMIVLFTATPLLILSAVQEDMIALLKAARWALLPSREILEKIRDLYADNHAKGTYNLTDFTKVFSIILESCLL